MSAMWCWPHELVQPEMLMRTPPTSASPAFSSASPMSAARPRDCVTARLQVSAPGHDDDVAGELGARLGHAQLGEAGVELGELLLGEAAQREVLTVGDADLDAEVALDLGEARGTGRS